MSEKQEDKTNLSGNTESTEKTDGVDSNAKKASFGSLTPLTTAQIITLLVGTTSSNSSYGGY